MKKIFDYRSPKEHYKAGACVVWCFDHRFDGLYDEFKKRKGWEKADRVNIAGGSKELASPENAAAREYVLGQISKSIKLHHAPLVVLMFHAECGAYGAAGVKFGEAAKESAFLGEESIEAERVVRKHLGPDSPVKIEKVVADFDALYEV